MYNKLFKLVVNASYFLFCSNFFLNYDEQNRKTSGLPVTILKTGKFWNLTVWAKRNLEPWTKYLEFLTIITCSVVKFLLDKKIFGNYIGWWRTIINRNMKSSKTKLNSNFRICLKKINTLIRHLWSVHHMHPCKVRTKFSVNLKIT